MELIDLVHFYSTAIDAKEWTALNRVFTPDCRIIYRSGTQSGDGVAPMRVFETCDEIIDAIAPLHDHLEASLHHMTNIVIRFEDEDRAVGRTYGRILLIHSTHPGGPAYQSAGIYDDRFVRTAQGWRIAERTWTRLYAEGNDRILEKPQTD
ncbi:hypothetical protein LK12_17310 [Novosphingobium malaysiense]|uniref:SnoaL-like domain-containing protein n=2 Tax=Novosphingobium malaysiense TaxID=1348853 RepID=A0A0B1ZM43_9SPHN|nr:hypothetical protein LK12_17310 [Novosphingobium malaysiense]